MRRVALLSALAALAGCASPDAAPRRHAEGWARESALGPERARVAGLERAGDAAAPGSRAAFKAYLSAFRAAAGDAVEEDRLREKLLRAVGRMSEPPGLPRAARRRMDEAGRLLDVAKGDADLAAAVAEQQASLREAPWHAVGYFNLAVMLERARRYGDAARAYRLYLAGAPDAANAAEVEARADALERMDESSGR